MRTWVKLTIAAILTATAVAGIGSVATSDSAPAPHWLTATVHPDWTTVAHPASVLTHVGADLTDDRTQAFIAAYDQVSGTDNPTFNAAAVQRNHDLMCSVFLGPDYAQLPTVLSDGTLKADYATAINESGFCS